MRLCIICSTWLSSSTNHQQTFALQVSLLARIAAMSKPPTILVAGTIGNTGKTVVRTLSDLFRGQSFPIAGLTQSLKRSAAQEFTAFPGVIILGKNWIEIDAAWLETQNVVKACIAPHNGPTQFAGPPGRQRTIRSSGLDSQQVHESNSLSHLRMGALGR